MHAILLLSHKGYEYIDNFCKQFDNDQDFNIYIHQDLKNKLNKKEIYLLKSKYKNIKCIISEYNCYYLKFSIVNAELLLIKEALKDKPTYCHLMSESCYLCVDKDIFKNFFKYNNDEYIEIKNCEKTKELYRVINNKYYHYGSQWFSLSYNFLNEIINHENFQKHIVEFIKYDKFREISIEKFNPSMDEVFFQNFIIKNSLNKKYKICNSLRYVSWEGRSNCMHPNILGNCDKLSLNYNQLKNVIFSDNILIIRKIDINNKKSVKFLKKVKPILNLKYELLK
jgi:hypothetical protein